MISASFILGQLIAYIETTQLHNLTSIDSCSPSSYLLGNPRNCCLYPLLAVESINIAINLLETEVLPVKLHTGFLIRQKFPL